mmetsp:Transcript_12367/g.27794  ORF Transcript_12367/g.27794 Transcript_12367/m.27794 type:complete len:278 (-) Transcript_12367:119-952(-)|eukprot:CAMPEP_0173207408 /NCGR_PEP_ID=MMETSP1141-20130122/21917_1 /TAXON_ID=483371 /ORGANISM="non described non described, Strain CCMP2298" /LENGTH=277 /DNA_ID=CAMNT_0014133691 /DNA_START=198 /DNA_END=1031 /DNA_ORIENTATION=+
MNSIFQNFLSNGKDSQAKVAFAVTAVVATAAVCYSYSGSSDLAPAMEEEETRKIMRKILEKVQLLAPRLMNAAQNIQQQIEQGGQEIDEKTLMKQFILPHFDTNFKEIQDSVLDGDCDYYPDELEEACAFYMKEGDEELTQICKSIRAIYRQFGGDVDDEEDASADGGALADMSVDEVVGLMEELGKHMLQATDDYCAKFIDESGIPRTQAHLEAFQMGQMKLSQKVEKSLLKECGLSESDFQKVLMANADNVAIQHVFKNMQTENTKLMAKHGIIG